MSKVTIIVEFETVEGSHAEFTRLMVEHARRSLNEEEGCLRFEVVQPVDQEGRLKPNTLVVNELYADQAAVDAHGASPRMATFVGIIDPMLKSRRRIEAHAIAEPHVDEGMRPEELNAANDD